jgi:branched-chain amino acid transport system permease protein
VYRLAMSVVCLVLALGLWWVIRRTRLGMIIRAGSSGNDGRDMVQSLGIDITLVYRIVFAAGVALAAFAGMLAAPTSSVFPGMGNQVLIICFVVVVIGGIGSVQGALVGAILIGLVDTFGKVLTLEVAGFQLLPQLSGVTVYLLMAVILLWRPEGLYGDRLLRRGG